MQLLDESWRPRYLRPNYLLYAFVILFVGFNTTIVVTTALPYAQGQALSFYWSVAIAALIFVSTLYWGVLRALQWNWGGQVPLGRKIGFEVRIHSQGDDEIPESLHQIMKDAIADGSRRRIEYKVCNPNRSITYKICG